ncbi:GntR family transcriptional regulator [Zongyangia hominis]|uniref:GntR family transcriptional regulator n=1 Tax=Zongyangia hominis TaxID=2763677 RepID=A0A926IAN3_9FIRM|nr:GntR family transcriptional regulator [Zongyangia hominis]MBC8570391.1 GntR family transcriptional regulator [Zongyangia hominis]
MNAKKQSLSDTVYEHILELILHGEIACGEKIPEDRIAAQLGISRTPIREALRKLAADGLIEIYPKRFAQVISFGEEDMRHLGVVRLSQDILAAQLAIYHGSNAEFDKLRQLGQECRRYQELDDLYMRAKRDAQFHLYLSEIGKNPILLRFQQQLYLKTRLLIVSQKAADRCDLSLHNDIVDALTARDEQAAVEVIVRHLGSFYDVGEGYRYSLQLLQK